MTKAQFFSITNPFKLVKKLKGYKDKIFLMNAFLVELKELNMRRKEAGINKEKAAKEVFKLIDSQINDLPYNSLEVSEMSSNLILVSKLVRNIDSL